MGTWITHTRIAENLLGKIDGLDPTAFAFGNLAPDSGKPNADWSAFDPPKSVTHFMHHEGKHHHIRDLEYYQNYVQDFPVGNKIEYSFRLGYFFHLVCDNLWMTKIAHPTEKKFNSLIVKDKNKAWELIKVDWYTLDHLYLSQQPQNIFSDTICNSLNPPAYLDFIVEDSLHYSLDFIRDYYTNPNIDIIYDRQFPYLTKSALDQFIVDATDKIYRIYLNRDQLNSLKGHSSLALIE